MSTNDTHSDTVALVRRALADDREALGILIVRDYHSVLRLCLRLLGSHAEAEDVAQEAALAACLGLSRLREPARFSAWLHAIAANLARVTLRRRHTLSLDALGEPPGVVTLWSAEPPDPVEVAAMRELHDTMIAALWELSPLSREAIIGFYLEGYSYAELAALLGVPVGTLKGRLVFGRRQLRGRLRHWVPELRGVNTQKEPSMELPDLIPVIIDSVRINTATQHRFAVLRDPSQAERVLPIFIGETEADAIAVGLAGQQLPRPMTHDLSLRLLEPLGGRVQRVIISRIAEHTFFADVEVAANEHTALVDARPSDALALAVRAEAPIFVARAVFEQSGLTGELTDTAVLEPGTPPAPRTTVLLVGMLEEDQQAIVGATLGVTAGMMGIHANAVVEEVLVMARDKHLRLAVVDLGRNLEGRLPVIMALHAQLPQLPIIVLGGDADMALQAGVTAYLPRPLDVEALGEAVQAVLTSQDAAGA